MTVLDSKLDGDSQTFLLIVSRAHQPPTMFRYMRTQSPVAFAMSSPTFLGDKPRGPILGASADEAPTSPPVARRWLESVPSVSFRETMQLSREEVACAIIVS